MEWKVFLLNLNLLRRALKGLPTAYCFPLLPFTLIPLHCKVVNSCFFGKNFDAPCRAERRSAGTSADGPCRFGCGSAALYFTLYP